MNAVLLWKEYREQRMLWLAIAVLAVVLVMILAEVLVPGGLWDGAVEGRMDSGVAVVAVCLAVAYGVVCGAFLLAGEREAGTLSFLDAHTDRRGGLWRAKLAAGALLTLTQSAYLSVLIVGLRFSGWQMPPLILALGLDALVWGLVGGALARFILTGVLVGVGLMAATWSLALVFVQTLPAVIVIKVLLAVVGGYAAWRCFCAPDLEGRAARPRLARVRRPLVPQSWRSMLWLTLRQGRWLLLGGLAVSIAVAPLVARSPLVVWPIATLALGVACGLAVFAPEQIGEQARFLGAQRVSPGVVWGVKTAAWVLALVVLSAILWCASLAIVLLRDAYRSTQAEQRLDWLAQWAGESFAAVPLNPVLFLTLWPVYGFAVGHFFSLVARRTVIAAILAGATASTLLAFWTPALVGGGLSMWQVSIVPVVLLMATRLIMWPWLGGRLHALRPMLAVGACLVAAAAATAGILCYRTVEVPEVGEPFDVRAFRGTLDKFAQNEAGALLRQAASDFREQRDKVEGVLGATTKRVFPEPAIDPGSPVNSPGISYSELLYDVLDKGWPQDDAAIGRWLNAMLEGSWAKHVHGAARMPLGLVADPRSRSWSDDVSRDMGSVLIVRALQQQTKGEHEGALDSVQTVLGLSRQVRNCAPALPFVIGQATEASAISGYDRWLRNLGPNGKQMRAGLELLTKHQQAIPDYRGALKAEYLIFQSRIPDWFNDFAKTLGFRPKEAAGAAVARATLAVPWEKVRQERIMRAIALGQYRAAERYAERLVGRDGGEARASPGMNAALAHEHGLPPKDGPGAELDASAWGRIIRSSQFARLAGSLSVYRVPSLAAHSVCRVRAAQLLTALSLYQLEHDGKPPAKLKDLVPRYLPAVPIDPFRAAPFQYRISDGEEVRGNFLSGESPRTESLAPGQGLVWSDTDRETWLYPVPVPKKK